MNDKVKSVVDNLDVIRQLYDGASYLTVIDREGIVSGFALPAGEPPMKEV